MVIRKNNIKDTYKLSSVGRNLKVFLSEALSSEGLGKRFQFRKSKVPEFSGLSLVDLRQMTVKNNALTLIASKI